MTQNAVNQSILKHPARRRYDSSLRCSHILEEVRQIPQLTIRDFCAKVVIHFCERFRHERHYQDLQNKKLNSIGTKALSSLYSFGIQKRRWYDEHPSLRRMVELFYIMPDEGLTWMGDRLGDTIGLLKIYAQVCDEVCQLPNLEDLTRICMTALETGSEEARELLVSIVGQDLYNIVVNE